MPNFEKIIFNVAYELLKKAAIKLPGDVKEALWKAYEEETVETGKAQLKAILENIKLAEENNLCVCQDTGVPLFFAKFNHNLNLTFNLQKPLIEATKKATADIPLRPNVINPLTKENLGTNVGWGMPYIYYDIDPDIEYIELTAFPKGFGSEAKSSLVFIATSEPLPKAFVKCVIDNVLVALGEPCPPTIIGVGIGGTSDIALHLAKKALLRYPLGSSNLDENVAILEKEILEAVNKTGLGPMASGGNTTALAVHVEICGTHTAVVPLGVTFQCWAARKSTARIYSDGRVVYLTHPGKGDD